MRPVFLGCGREHRNLLFCPDKTKHSREHKAVPSNQIWKFTKLPKIASVLFVMLCCIARVQSIPMDFTMYLTMSQSGGSAFKAELPQLRDHQIYFSVKKKASTCFSEEKSSLTKWKPHLYYLSLSISSFVLPLLSRSSVLTTCPLTRFHH